MLDFKQLEICLKEKRFVDGLHEINNEIAHIKEMNKLSYVKNWLSNVSSPKNLFKIFLIKLPHLLICNFV
ncbi:hypothetical protein, partial [Bacillus mycoides]|uniref:hypothetical protein n=1 Tax=Bacillus mycoides TaxID=1405 RepID=UPI0011A994C8